MLLQFNSVVTGHFVVAERKVLVGILLILPCVRLPIKTFLSIYKILVLVMMILLRKTIALYFPVIPAVAVVFSCMHTYYVYVGFVSQAPHDFVNQTGRAQHSPPAPSIESVSLSHKEYVSLQVPCPLEKTLPNPPPA